MNVEELIGQYGDLFYLVTFVWTAFEGETFVLIAGYAASLGYLNLPLLIVCAWLGSFVGDQAYFLLGRRFGPAMLRRFPRWQPGVTRALTLLERYNVGFILSFRFIYGVRNFSSFAIGMSQLSWPRFLFLNFIAAGLWATSFAGGGYLFGEVLKTALGDAAFLVGVVLLACFIGAGVYLMRRQGAVTPPAQDLPVPNNDDSPDRERRIERR